MKKALSVLALLCALFLLLVSCTPYQGDKATENGVTCYLSNFFGPGAFAAYYEWDGDPSHTEIEIPDVCGGQDVVSIGGFMGTGVPIAFAPVSEDLQAPVDKDADPVEVTFTVSFGPAVKDIKRIGLTGPLYIAQNGKNVAVSPRYYMVARPGNETFYTENGHVYLLADHSLVTDIPYWDGAGEE